MFSVFQGVYQFFATKDYEDCYYEYTLSIFIPNLTYSRFTLMHYLLLIQEYFIYIYFSIFKGDKTCSEVSVNIVYTWVL